MKEILRKLIVAMVYVIALICVAVFYIGGIYLAWNFAVPDIFGLPEITIPQAVALFLLAGFFFSQPAAFVRKKRRTGQSSCSSLPCFKNTALVHKEEPDAN